MMRGFFRDVAGILLSECGLFFRMFGAIIVVIFTGFAYLGAGILGVPAVCFGIFGLVLFPLSVLDLLFGLFDGKMGFHFFFLSSGFLIFSISYFLVVGSAPHIVKQIFTAARNNFRTR